MASGSGERGRWLYCNTFWRTKGKEVGIAVSRREIRRYNQLAGCFIGDAMPMIPIETGAARLGVPVETLEAWARKGLLAVESRVSPQTPGQFVDEEQLHDVAESLGWLLLSS